MNYNCVKYIDNIGVLALERKILHLKILPPELCVEVYAIITLHSIATAIAFLFCYFTRTVEFCVHYRYFHLMEDQMVPKKIASSCLAGTLKLLFAINKVLL